MPTRKCNGCQRSLTATAFSRNAQSPDGLYSRCRECKATANAKRRAQADPLAEATRAAVYYAANRERIAVVRRARYAADREKALAKNAEWRTANLDRHRELCRKWAREHPVEMRAIVATRRARVAQAGGRYTKTDVATMFLAQGGKCRCGADLMLGYHVDHVMPLSRGGANDPSNLQLLCPPCNRRKGARLPHELGRSAPEPAVR